MRSSSPSGLRKGTWTEEEDSLLRKCIEKYGEGKWHQVPYRAGLNRCRKSCRLRWLNYLRPNIKRGDFSSDEVDLIIRLHKLLGNRWSLIAGRIPGRTANDVKNFWNTHIQKKLADDEAGSSFSKNKAEKTIKGTMLFKPQPLNFSKNNAPLLRENAQKNTTTKDPNIPNISAGSVPTKSFPMADHDMQWLDNLLNDKEMSQEPTWTLGGCWDESELASLMCCEEELCLTANN